MVLSRGGLFRHGVNLGLPGTCFNFNITDLMICSEGSSEACLLRLSGSEGGNAGVINISHFPTGLPIQQYYSVPCVNL